MLTLIYIIFARVLPIQSVTSAPEFTFGVWHRFFFIKGYDRIPHRCNLGVLFKSVLREEGTKELTMAQRIATVRRETRETNINLELGIDGEGNFEITTGIRMFDHLLAQLARHGAFDLKLSGTGDDPHHLVEDVALCLGQAFAQSVGEKKGIVRMAHAVVPMDDALALIAVDIGGRGYAFVEASFDEKNMAGLPSDLVCHFLETFASEARINLHAKILRGANDHHKAEAIFKALARALDSATQIDQRIAGRIPSTKGMIEG